jgi:hypothetical protein
MRSSFILILYLFAAVGDSLADLDLLSDFISYGDEMLFPQDELLFEYDQVGTAHTFESLAWNLDDAFPLQEESFLADTIDVTDVCTLDSMQPVGKVRARGPVCEAPPPRKKKPKAPFWVQQADDRDLLGLTFTLEELACNNQGYEYIVCDSGDLRDSELMISMHYHLEKCDLCTFACGYPSL